MILLANVGFHYETNLKYASTGFFTKVIKIISYKENYERKICDKIIFLSAIQKTISSNYRKT